MYSKALELMELREAGLAARQKAKRARQLAGRGGLRAGAVFKQQALELEALATALETWDGPVSGTGQARRWRCAPGGEGAPIEWRGSAGMERSGTGKPRVKLLTKLESLPGPTHT